MPCQLEGLTEKDLLKILTGPKCSLTKQATELMATEGVTLRFGEESLQEIARVSAEVRRLAASLSGVRHFSRERAFSSLDHGLHFSNTQQPSHFRAGFCCCHALPQLKMVDQ